MIVSGSEVVLLAVPLHQVELLVEQTRGVPGRGSDASEFVEAMKGKGKVVIDATHVDKF